ncbi:MAG: alpha-L-fucosidase, partial [Clostridia bacterium]|nr:alpha-L-fucosidase [Clostridia bacterium]
MHKTDWMHDAGWGVFTHYLHHSESWNETVASFDTERLAKKLHDIGAGYYFITIMQRSKYMLAPNDTYNRITGYAPGEACPTRDLIADLYESLSRYGIRLCLYYTGDGPLDDAQAGAAMGLLSEQISGKPERISVEFANNWASVLREYSLRYGDKISAWWVDGCYEWLGYNEETLGILADAARAGNPDALVSLNCGVMERVSAYSRHDDFTTGEMNAFRDLPEARFAGGAQWHSLIHLGTFWARFDAQIDGPALAAYVREVNARGGVITIDIGITPEGDLGDEQLQILSHIRN